MNARAHFPTTDDDAPRDLRTEGGGGKIYPIDPAAVAHFKAVLAQQQVESDRKRRPSPGIRRGGNGRLDADLQRKIDELQVRARQRAAAAQAETKELDVTEKRVNELTETAVREAHGRFSQGESVKTLADELGVPWQTLRGQFRRYGLPAGREGARKRQPVRAAAKVETAVVPVQATAVATNGHAQPDDLREQLAVIQEQLAVIQELLGLAEAKQVTLRGKISVELHAEVAF
ncbi:MAG: hypothetical protein H6661_10210 [Ardenticatenaceae bacterium]|nr:hypothetical protein [Ardenticatenaceae bacterium]